MCGNTFGITNQVNEWVYLFNSGGTQVASGNTVLLDHPFSSYGSPCGGVSQASSNLVPLSFNGFNLPAGKNYTIETYLVSSIEVNLGAPVGSGVYATATCDLSVGFGQLLLYVGLT